MTNAKRSLKDLNLLDRFLFAEAMEDQVIMQNLLEIILGKEITLKYLPQTEKEQRTAPFRRYVKLDVWAWDMEDTVYDAEVQKEDTRNLPKRSRLYQSMIDVKLLDPGEIDFNQLNQVYIIMIMPFDPFGKGLYKYTFRMNCEEASDMNLEDGATRIFLNTHGTNEEDVSTELTELLRYMEHTTEEVSRKCGSKRIQDMQKRIERIKSSEEVEVRYMQAWEEKVLGEQRAREEGREEGLKEGREEGREEGRREGEKIGRREGEEIGRREGEMTGRMEMLIEICKDSGLSKADTIARLCEKCRVSEKEAEEYIERYSFPKR